MEDENFRKELEELFRLFKRLIEKESLDENVDIDPQQMEQLKAFMAQFEDVKDKLRIEMVPVDPFSKMMVSTLVQQLREQLGPEDEEVTHEPLEEATSIAAIDEQLKNPDLTDEEIDELLDRRMQISSNLPLV
jgi:hypothetical protein